MSLGRGRKRLKYYLAVAFLSVNILLTVTDQVGLFDWITLVLDVGLLALLVATRAKFLSVP